MSNPDGQVKALQDAILKRAEELAKEHVNQGKLMRVRTLHDAHDKVQVMEKKELLAAKEAADREYHRLVQASDLRMQAELDRNRWGLVQSVMDKVRTRVTGLANDQQAYRDTLLALLRDGVEQLGQDRVIAHLNAHDQHMFAAQWDQLTAGIAAEVELSSQTCDCSGGVRIYSVDGDMLVDHTFEGIIQRRQDELMRLVFERLFSEVPAIGVKGHG